MKYLPLLLLCALPLFFGFVAQSQDWRLHLGGNETYLFGNDLQGYYPILWYSSEEGRGILVGGFGGGLSYTTATKGVIRLRYQANVQRSRYYEQPSILTDVNGAPISGAIGINTNLNASVFAMPQFEFSPRLSAGFGLGARYTFFSNVSYQEVNLNGENRKLKFPDRSFAPLVIFVPVEVELAFNRLSYALRLEPNLTKVSLVNGDARNLLFFVEIGYRFGGISMREYRVPTGPKKRF